LTLGVVSGSLEVSATSSRTISTIIAVYVVVMVTISNDKQNLLNASTAEHELVNTETHAR
jgi:hypothetical protein